MWGEMPNTRSQPREHTHTVVPDPPHPITKMPARTHAPAELPEVGVAQVREAPNGRVLVLLRPQHPHRQPPLLLSLLLLLR